MGCEPAWGLFLMPVVVGGLPQSPNPSGFPVGFPPGLFILRIGPLEEENCEAVPGRKGGVEVDLGILLVLPLWYGIATLERKLPERPTDGSGLQAMINAS